MQKILFGGLCIKRIIKFGANQIIFGKSANQCNFTKYYMVNWRYNRNLIPIIMSLTKLDLYKSEWLDLVFAGKNKNYGAYYLRQHYASNMLKALGITFLSVGAAIAMYSFINANVTPPAEIIDKEILVILDHPPTVEPEKPVEPIKAEAPKPEPQKAAAPAIATKVIPVNVTSDERKAIDPPTITELEGVAIASTNNEGKNGNINVSPGESTTPGGGGTGEGTAEDNSVYNAAGLSEMPEPVGGAQAWGKFLQRNLRYPAIAEEQGISGRVLLSFIIEKDGSLSSITVDRKAGFGFDEEALRVLKKAAAWKPGMQNGRPVRVKYSIPINFRLPE